MPHLNVEIKARCKDLGPLRDILIADGADAKGTDKQIDTYFKGAKGRIKLRQGNIECSLIHYTRSDQAGPKNSHVHLYHPQPTEAGKLYELLTAAYGTAVEVRKAREIYFIQNVKFHLDTVEGLGTFAEIEAIDSDGSLGDSHLHEQCTYYMRRLGIQESDLLTNSYSDMLASE